MEKLEISLPEPVHSYVYSYCNAFYVGYVLYVSRQDQNIPASLFSHEDSSDDDN